MRRLAFRSIRTRLMGATALLIVALVGVVMWLWAVQVRATLRAQKAAQAQSIVVALGTTWWGLLQDQNWGQLRVDQDFLLRENPELVYVLVTDDRRGEQIVASAPAEFQEQFVPDLVPVAVTEAARRASARVRTAETFLLRAVEHPRGVARGRAGERVLDVSGDLRNTAGRRMGTFRIGLSLAQVERAVAAAVRTVLIVGALALAFGLLGALLLARRLTEPLLALQASVERIAAGDLGHRARVHARDEIGALAAAFNEMTVALQGSFERLRGTLSAFERFVPRKFLAVVAPGGVEHIAVGVSARKTITILFSDIRGYTSLSERSTAGEMFQFLNEYLPRMGRAIDAEGGFIDKYIGDAVMALFEDAHSDGALRAALAMRATLAVFNEERRAAGLPTIDAGIGMHRGEVVMGTVGFASKIESTVIGDPVNLASRVEGITKDYGCAILVTGAVVAALRDPGTFRLRLVDDAVRVKGKGEAIAIYALEA